MESKKMQIKPLYILIAVLVVVVAAALVYFVFVAGVGQVAAAGDTVSVYYNGTFTNGTVFDSNFGGQALNFTVGANQVIQGFNNAVIGMKIGQTKSVTIPPNEAYGPVNSSLIISIPLKVFGNETAKVGMIVTQQTGSGQQIEGLITALNTTNATVNFNPPLAGKTLDFKIEVLKITRK
jgi:FKBP-type peptidyl-prolyl cis-trans isomerase 2